MLFVPLKKWLLGIRQKVATLPLSFEDLAILAFLVATVVLTTWKMIVWGESRWLLLGLWTRGIFWILLFTGALFWVARWTGRYVQSFLQRSWRDMARAYWWNGAVATTVVIAGLWFLVKPEVVSTIEVIRQVKEEPETVVLSTTPRELPRWCVEIRDGENKNIIFPITDEGRMLCQVEVLNPLVYYFEVYKGGRLLDTIKKADYATLTEGYYDIHVRHRKTNEVASRVSFHLTYR